MIKKQKSKGLNRNSLKTIKLKAYAKGTLDDIRRTPFNWIDLLLVSFASALVALVLHNLI
jgi:hypothetical protein